MSFKSQPTEWDFISIAKKIFTPSKNTIVVGAGEDDCAVIKVNSKKYLVLTTDILHESSDFPPQMSFWEKGFLSLAVNLSDIAAMGAKPYYFLYSIILHDLTLQDFKEFCMGIKSLADKYNVEIVGGDTDSGNELTVSGFAVGYASKPLLRKNAKVGDKVYITDVTGKAQLSLNQLFSGMDREEIAYPEKLYTPDPRVKEGILLSKSANACTDVSDSLAISLNQIALASNVSIELNSKLIDLSYLTEFTKKEEALELFLYAGGDYELVYTCSCKECKIGYEIGKIVKPYGKPEVKIDGKTVEFRGYTH